ASAATTATSSPPRSATRTSSPRSRGPPSTPAPCPSRSTRGRDGSDPSRDRDHPHGRRALPHPRGPRRGARPTHEQPRRAPGDRRARNHLGGVPDPQPGLTLPRQPREAHAAVRGGRHDRDRRPARAAAGPDRPLGRLGERARGGDPRGRAHPARLGPPPRDRPRPAHGRGDRPALGVLYTRFGVPSFVITLAGLLGVLGLQLKVLGPTGSINLPYDSPIVQFAQSWFLPPYVA